MAIGRNTASSKKLSGYVYELERIAESKDELTTERAAVMARALAEGFTPKVINAVVKIRKEKPHDRAEFQSLLDSYLHALGMDEAPALFRHVGMMGVDLAARESVIDALKLLAPVNGEFILKTKDGQPVRIFRDKDGEPQVEDWKEPEPEGGLEPTPLPQRGREPREVPEGTPAEAEAMGVVAFKANVPITQNPFPFDDPRRPRWDKGWRKGSTAENEGPEPPAAKKKADKKTGEE